MLARNGLQVWSTAVTGGRREFARSLITDISGDPVFDGAGTVFASNQAGRTVRLDADTGERAWTTGGRLLRPGLAGRRLGLPAVGHRRAGARRCGDGRAPVAGAAAGILPEPGLVRPRQALRGDPLLRAGAGRRAGSGSPAPTGCCAPSARRTGRRWRRCRSPGGAAGPPAVAGGVMYVSTRDGKLLAFQ